MDARELHEPGEGPACLNVSELIDGRALGGFQKRVLWLVGSAIVMDGFDVQAMGYVAPAIVRDWGVARAALGPVFAASLVGMLVGSLFFSGVADRRGRRPVLIGSTLLFAACMLVTVFARSLEQLLVMRLLTGFGLGGVMANAVALAGEYSPLRRRVSMMMWVSCGFTAGGLLGGLLSAVMIPWLGWRSVFVLGGIVPLAVGATMVRLIPESVQWLVARGAAPGRVRHWLGRIAPELEIGADTLFVVPSVERAGSTVTELFRSGRAPTTLVLWGANFMNLLVLFFLSNWLPTIAADAGYDANSAVLAGALLQGGGMLGTLAMGPLVDRLGFYRVLVPGFALAVVSIAAIGQAGLPVWMLLAAVGVSGYCIVGGQPALNALAASVYPTSIRATGMGWSLGIGRAGSIVGPVLAGQLIGLHWANPALFMAAAVPALVSAALLAWLGRRRSNEAVATRARAPLLAQLEQLDEKPGDGRVVLGAQRVAGHALHREA